MSLPLHAEISCPEEAGSCRVDGDEVEATETAPTYLAEVTSLRQRITELEDQLAQRLPRASEEAEASVSTAPSTQPAVVATEETDSSRKCVSEAFLTDARAATMSQHEVNDTAGDFATFYESETEPALSWTDPDASFEERMAARAFFDADGDESARRWLLED